MTHHDMIESNKELRKIESKLTQLFENVARVRHLPSRGGG